MRLLFRQCTTFCIMGIIWRREILLLDWILKCNGIQSQLLDAYSLLCSYSFPPEDFDQYRSYATFSAGCLITHGCRVHIDFSLSICFSSTFITIAKDIYSLYAVRLVLGCIILSSLPFFRKQIKKNFGSQVEAFFVLLTALQLHMLFYCTQPLPKVSAFGLVNLVYGYWFDRRFYAALNSLPQV